MTAGDHFNLFTEIGRGLASDGVTSGQMMGHPCLKAANRKIAATYYDDAILVKLPAAEHTAWLAKPGVQVFEPMPGRPMKQWAQIPADYADDWEALIVSSLRHLSN